MKIIFAIVMAFTLLACDNNVMAQSSRAEIVSQDGKTHGFDVELALTPLQQQKGLMNRSSMADDAGMLFFFGDEAPRAFWMKNTLIPLDIIFIKQNGIIHHIHENAIPHDLTSIPSQGDVAAVLEINGGLSAKLGIARGDKVKHALFGNE